MPSYLLQNFAKIFVLILLFLDGIGKILAVKRTDENTNHQDEHVENKEKASNLSLMNTSLANDCKCPSRTMGKSKSFSFILTKVIRMPCTLPKSCSTNSSRFKNHGQTRMKMKQFATKYLSFKKIQSKKSSKKLLTNAAHIDESNLQHIVHITPNMAEDIINDIYAIDKYTDYNEIHNAQKGGNEQFDVDFFLGLRAEKTTVKKGKGLKLLKKSGSQKHLPQSAKGLVVRNDKKASTVELFQGHINGMSEIFEQSWTRKFESNADGKVINVLAKSFDDDCAHFIEKQKPDKEAEQHTHEEGRGEHALCILQRLFTFCLTIEKQMHDKRIHFRQEAQEGMKAKLKWLRQAAFLILEHLMKISGHNLIVSKIQSGNGIKALLAKFSKFFTVENEVNMKPLENSMSIEDSVAIEDEEEDAKPEKIPLNISPPKQLQESGFGIKMPLAGKRNDRKSWDQQNFAKFDDKFSDEKYDLRGGVSKSMEVAVYA